MRDTFLASEKAILRRYMKAGDEGKGLCTDVRQFKPTTFDNPVPEHRIGRYRSLDQRMCVTAEMDVIRYFLEVHNQNPPSFLEAGPRQKLFFDPRRVRAGIVTPGGVAPGLNTVIHSIVNMHMHPNLYSGEHKVFGFRRGFAGLALDKKRPLRPEVTKEWIHKGGTELRTSRGDQAISEMVDTLEANGLDILYVVGGDGSLTAGHLIAGEIKQRKLSIVVAGVPKTMDNDILWVWHSFGFDTAVEAATQAANAIHDDTKATERICLMQLFGRDAGFVAAHAALASGQADAVLVPEVSFHIEPVLDYVRQVLIRKNYALIIVAEGACPEEYSEEYTINKLKQEGHDSNTPGFRANPYVNARLAAGKLEFIKDAFDARFGREESFRRGRHKPFLSQPRHLIRAVPPSSVDQIYCQRLADLVVHSALAGFTDFMISQWLTEYVLVPLDLVVDQRHPGISGRVSKAIPPGGIFWTTVTSSTGQPSFRDR